MKKHKNRSQKARDDKQTIAAVAASVEEHAAEQQNLLEGLSDMAMNTPSVQTNTAAAAPANAAGSADADASASASDTPEPAVVASETPDSDAPAPPATRYIHTESLGQRLRAAREARGWSCGDVASKLHLPAQIVRTIESDCFEAIGHRIYLRGYLTSYVRLMELPTVLVDTALQQHPEPPPLVTSGTISHPRYLFQRYSVSALYLILTGVIIVPAVLLAMRAGMEPRVSELASLDSPTTSIASHDNAGVPASTASTAAAEPVAGATSDASGDAPHAESPLAASMAPFQALSHSSAPVQPAATVPAAVSGAHMLRLSLKEASWVEITSAKGEKLQYGILPAGAVRSFSSDYALDVRLGNSSGAEVELDGQAQDLAPYRRSNVAHFKAFTGDQAISRTD